MNTATAIGQTKAKDCQVGQSLLAQIKCNIEWAGKTIADAEALCLGLHGCPLDEITVEQAYAVLNGIAEFDNSQPEPHDGYCMTCERPSSLRQCMDCREGRAEGYRPRYQSIV